MDKMVIKELLIVKKLMSIKAFEKKINFTTLIASA
jgi:hypothetical protein